MILASIKTTRLLLKLFKWKENFTDGKEGEYWCSNREPHGTMVTGMITKHAPKAEVKVSKETSFKKKLSSKHLKILEMKTKLMSAR